MVRYEDLVAAPERATRELAQFLGASGSVRDDGSSTTTFDPDEEPWKQRAGEPVDESRTDRWRHELDRRSQGIVTWLAGRELSHFGYERELSVMAGNAVPGVRAIAESRDDLKRHQRRLEGIRSRANQT